MNGYGKREVIIILGKTGFGKSTWLKKYLAGQPRVFVFDPFRDIESQYLPADQIIASHESGELKKLQSFSIGAFSPNDFDLLGSIAYLTGNCHLVIEECGVAFYKGERIPEWLQEAIFLGRHVNLSLIFTAQRATSIPVDLRSQASRFVSFRQTESSDLKWTKDYLGEHYEELPTLDELECLDSDNKTVSRYRIAPLGK